MKSFYQKFLNFLEQLSRARQASALARMGDYTAAKKFYE